MLASNCLFDCLYVLSILNVNLQCFLCCTSCMKNTVKTKCYWIKKKNIRFPSSYPYFFILLLTVICILIYKIKVVYLLICIVWSTHQCGLNVQTTGIAWLSKAFLWYIFIFFYKFDKIMRLLWQKNINTMVNVIKLQVLQTRGYFLQALFRTTV